MFAFQVNLFWTFFLLFDMSLHLLLNLNFVFHLYFPLHHMFLHHFLKNFHSLILLLMLFVMFYHLPQICFFFKIYILFIFSIFLYFQLLYLYLYACNVGSFCASSFRRCCIAISSLNTSIFFSCPIVLVLLLYVIFYIKF